jgi:hypothetical protein
MCYSLFILHFWHFYSLYCSYLYETEENMEYDNIFFSSLNPQTSTQYIWMLHMSIYFFFASLFHFTMVYTNYVASHREDRIVHRKVLIILTRQSLARVPVDLKGNTFLKVVVVRPSCFSWCGRNPILNDKRRPFCQCTGRELGMRSW